jgi:hypothetical protein
VTFEEARRHLGVETQRQWSDLAIHRTTPLLFGLFSLVILWASELAAKTGKAPFRAVAQNIGDSGKALASAVSKKTFLSRGELCQ